MSPKVRERAGTTTSIYNGRLGVPSPMSMSAAPGGGGGSLARGRAGTTDSSPEGSPFAGPASGVQSSASSRSTSTYGQNRLGVPTASGRQEASPFGASGDELEEMTDDDQAPAPPLAQPRPAAPAGREGMTRAMSGLKLPSASDNQAAAGAGVGECSDGCGCDEFKQNLFKPKGNCASCYHVHET